MVERVDITWILGVLATYGVPLWFFGITYLRNPFHVLDLVGVSVATAMQVYYYERTFDDTASSNFVGLLIIT